MLVVLDFSVQNHEPASGSPLRDARFGVLCAIASTVGDRLSAYGLICHIDMTDAWQQSVQMNLPVTQPNLDGLATFLAVAQLQGFRAAARELG
jgi:hypothetical protein